MEAGAGDVGWQGVLIDGASVFMAYEGFQLLAYDYDEIDDADRVLRSDLRRGGPRRGLAGGRTGSGGAEGSGTGRGGASGAGATAFPAEPCWCSVRRHRSWPSLGELTSLVGFLSAVTAAVVLAGSPVTEDPSHSRCSWASPS